MSAIENGYIVRQTDNPHYTEYKAIPYKEETKSTAEIRNSDIKIEPTLRLGWNF